jgi:hypothetical protein
MENSSWERNLGQFSREPECRCMLLAVLMNGICIPRIDHLPASRYLLFSYYKAGPIKLFVLFTLNSPTKPYWSESLALCLLFSYVSDRDGKLSRHERAENQGNSGSDEGRGEKEPMGLPFPKRSDVTGGASRLSRILSILARCRMQLAAGVMHSNRIGLCPCNICADGSVC